MSREQFEDVSEPVQDELYAISGSGFGFPSSKYEDLELGASGTSYTAPANGYFYFSKKSSATGQYGVITGGTDGVAGELGDGNAASGFGVHILRPVRKGVSVKVTYTVAGATNYFRFIYAEGE